MPPRRDPYAVLGVPRTASPADIRAAYRRLALAHHPDKAGGGGDRDAFAEAAAAHAVLADPASRAAYDARSAGGAASDAAADALDDLAGVTVDVSSLGVVDAALLSVFSKLGVRVAHAPPPSVLEAARLGLFEAAPLAWGSACVAGSVDRGAAQWFRVALAVSVLMVELTLVLMVALVALLTMVQVSAACCRLPVLALVVLLLVVVEAQVTFRAAQAQTVAVPVLVDLQ